MPFQCRLFGVPGAWCGLAGFAGQQQRVEPRMPDRDHTGQIVQRAFIPKRRGHIGCQRRVGQRAVCLR